MEKRLYRSRKERKLLGVLGGIGEYLGHDPVFVRLAYIALMLVTGILPLALGYLIGYFIMPPGPPDPDDRR